MQLTFLGTSSMVPTKERNQTAVFLSYESDGILFDCGEGTQRQLKRIEKLFEAFVFDKRLDFSVSEVGNGLFFENNSYSLEAFQLEHGIETLGFRFIEKDKRKIIMG